ncbi:hypothetical protein SF23_18215 [Streptomyces sp. MBRL 10]|nr:hypothetical protein SF23_18215 [Streptomyces sp. MBRL 10]
MHAGYPNRERALRKIHRTRVQRYKHDLANHPQRYVMGFSMGIESAVDRTLQRMRQAVLAHGYPQVIIRSASPSD